MSRFILFAMVACVSAAQTPSDPLQYTVFLGLETSISSVAVDDAGSAYITGSTRAPLPVTAGALQTQYAQPTCSQGPPFGGAPAPSIPCQVAFAGKLNADGTAFSYLTYLPISSSSGARIAVDALGNAWITGAAYSDDLPVTLGAPQTHLKGSASAFLIKLSATGSSILFATYLGGNAAGIGLALDANSYVYVVGGASQDLPVTANAFQSDGVPYSSFVARFDSSGNLIYATYLHGDAASETSAGAIAADSTGAVYVVGSTHIPSFPVTPGAFQTTAQSQDSAFVAKLDPNGSKLIYATYLSGAGAQYASGIAVSDRGEAIVSGVDDPGLGDTGGLPFPVTPGAFQTALNPAVSGVGTNGGAFLLKLNATGSGLIFSTLLGGSDSLAISDLKVDTAGNVFVTGNTYALDTPTTAGAIEQCGPNGEMWQERGFLAEFSANGSTLTYGSFLGTGGAVALAMDAADYVYVAGNFGNLPVVAGSFGWTGSGTSVVKLSAAPLPPGSVSCVANAASRDAHAIAAGEIVDILGRGIGPQQEVQAAVANGSISTTLAGTQVLFNGVAAPILYAGPDRIGAVVPFEIFPPELSGSTPTTIQVTGGGAPAGPTVATAVGTMPAIYSVDGSSAGQALLVNEDGTINSQSNPADQGSIVTLYATGLNQTQPAVATGAVAVAPAALVLPITISSPNGIAISTQLSSAPGITYAGAAPGLVAGVTQINFRIPVSIFHGITPITIQSGTFQSQTGIYFYMK